MAQFIETITVGNATGANLGSVVYGFLDVNPIVGGGGGFRDSPQVL